MSQTCLKCIFFTVDKTENLNHASEPAAVFVAGDERGGGVGRKK